MKEIIIRGDLSCEDVAEALKKSFPDKHFKLNPSTPRPDHPHGNGHVDHEVEIFSSTGGHKSYLHKKMEETELELHTAEEAAQKAVSTIQTLHKQQKDLFDEFVLLRQRYDEQKAATVTILWNQCAKYHPDLRQIPSMQDTHTFTETDERIGNLIVGDFLGEGQFATVKNCVYEGKDHEYALKIIKKERITSFTSLMRVSNEIDNLKMLKSPYIVSVEQVIHTQDMLYIVTEKGGKDLFDFFDEHPHGVKESWAREIIVCIMKGVMYCHEQGICHRDLKPENILVTFNTDEERCVDLKLCDFGLSTKFKAKQLLTDFCGSPGFFAPEMIIHGSYFGDKADVWSVGCIILELVLGHERFCDTWMTAYDYEVLQDKGLFTQTIENTVNELHDHLDFSSELNDFIPRFLELRSSKRPFIKALAGHGWLGDLLMDDLIGGNGRNKLSFDAGRPLSPPGGLSPSPSFNHGQFPSTQVSQETINAAYRNWSEKERKHMEDYIQHHQDDDDHHLHLPPIIPATPSIHGAKKILRKGDELASKATASLAEPSQAGFWSPGGGNCNTESPHSSSKSYHTPLRNSIHLPMVVEGQEDQLNDSGKVPTGEERANSAPLLQLGGAFEVELEKSDSKPTLKSSISSGLMLGGGAK